MTLKSKRRASLFAIAALAVSIALPATADARSGPRRGHDYVVAHSNFGNGSVTGAVRWTRKGPQVQLPGGAWVYCERTCKDTLRLKTVDFFQSEEGAGGRAAIAEQPGLLHRWLHWERSY